MENDYAAEHLFKIGHLLSSTCPSASRFYISNFERRHRNKNPNSSENKKKNYIHLYCHHCGSIWNSNNFKVYTQSPKINHHIKKLMKMERNEEWKLNNRQKKKLKRFYASTSKIVYRCFICKKVTLFPGSKSRNRSMSTTDTSTPASKIKINRKDINAGLFIASPINSLNEKKNLEKSEVSSDISTEMTESCQDSLDISNNTKEYMNNSSKDGSSLNCSKVLPELNSSKKSSVKRKKTLLAQILNQEQSKKKKTNLSAFLVSL